MQKYKYTEMLLLSNTKSAPIKTFRTENDYELHYIITCPTFDDTTELQANYLAFCTEGTVPVRRVLRSK